MKQAILAIIALVFAGCRSAPVAQQPDGPQGSSFWGNLRPGTYYPGYRTTWKFDASRRYGRARERPIFIAMWYPVDVRSAPGITNEVPAIGQFMRDLTVKDILGKEANDADATEQGRLKQLLDTPLPLYRDATPAPGRFPVIIYHASAAGPFQEDATLFEFLASHGYVVLSSAYQSPDPASLANNVSGATTSIQDMQFLVRHGATLAFADISKIGAIGFSMGSQTMLQWIGTKDCPVDAAVILDTTLEYTPEDFPLHRMLQDALKDLTPPSIPVLLAASSIRKPNFATFHEFLGKAPVYEVEVRTPTHGEFVANGILHREFLVQSEEERLQGQRPYEDLTNAILLFLNHALYGHPEGLSSAGSRGTASWRYKAPIGEPGSVSNTVNREVVIPQGRGAPTGWCSYRLKSDLPDGMTGDSANPVVIGVIFAIGGGLLLAALREGARLPHGFQWTRPGGARGSTTLETHQRRFGIGLGFTVVFVGVWALLYEALAWIFG